MKTFTKIVLMVIGIGLAVVAAVALLGIAVTVDGQYQRPSRETTLWMCLAAMNAAAAVGYGLFAARTAMTESQPDSTH